jgi:hypothetical protein
MSSSLLVKPHPKGSHSHFLLSTPFLSEHTFVMNAISKRSHVVFNADKRSLLPYHLLSSFLEVLMVVRPVLPSVPEKP